jgi:excinuclease ABC subunit A
MVVAEGTPEDVAANPESYTGAFLKPLLDGREAKQPTRKKPAAKAPAARSPARKTATKKTTARRTARKSA